MKGQNAGTIRTGALGKEEKAQPAGESGLYFRLDSVGFAASGAVNINGAGKGGNPSYGGPGAHLTLGDKRARRYGAINDDIQIAKMVAGNQSRVHRRARDFNAPVPAGDREP